MTSEKQKKPFSIQAAEVCIAAPLLALIIGMLTISSNSSRSIAIGIASLQGIIILTGAVFGIISLKGISQYGAKAILPKTIIGLFLSSALMFMAVSAIKNARSKAHKAKEKALAQAEQDGKNAFFQEGWYGVYQDEEKQAVVTSLPDTSKGGKTFNSLFNMNISVAQVTVKNLSSKDVVADSSKVKLTLLDATEISSIPILEVLNSAIKDRKKGKKMFLGPHQIKPNQSFYNILIALPYGFDWSKVASVSFVINEKPIDINGKVYTREEKQQLYEAGLKAQKNKSNN